MDRFLSLGPILFLIATTGYFVSLLSLTIVARWPVVAHALASVGLLGIFLVWLVGAAQRGGGRTARTRRFHWPLCVVALASNTALLTYDVAETFPPAWLDQLLNAGGVLPVVALIVICVRALTSEKEAFTTKLSVLAAIMFFPLMGWFLRRRLREGTANRGVAVSA